MGIMSQIAMEREDALSEARGDYQEAYSTLQAYMDKHPPAHRKPQEMAELARLDSICMSAKYRYEAAKYQRYRL